MPDNLFHMVTNASDFCGVLVFDKWTSNSDGRQAIFFRPPRQDCVANSACTHNPAKTSYLALMIDQGFLFHGPQWDFFESPLQGLYTSRLVYEKVTSLDDFQPWLD